MNYFGPRTISNARLVLAPLACAALLAAADAHAAPAVVRYQGTLTDASGGAVAAGDFTMSFALFANPTATDGESALWRSADTAVAVGADGAFVASLDLSGTDAPMRAALGAAPRWFLEITVDGDHLGGRQELPALPSAAFAAQAQRAATADTLTGLSPGDAVSCPPGDVVKASVAGWVCAADDVGTPFSVQVGSGLRLNGGNLSLDPGACGPGDTPHRNSTNDAWVCAGDRIGATSFSELGGVASDAQLPDSVVRTSTNTWSAILNRPTVVASISGIANDGGDVTLLGTPGNLSVIPDSDSRTIRFAVAQSLFARVVSLEENLATAVQRISTLEAGECPPGYTQATDTLSTNNSTWIVCKKALAPGAVDEVMKVGNFWVDRYETSQCDSQGTGSLGGVNGSGTTAIACSRAFRPVQRDVTWFQAAAMCANAGKRLCTNEEWQTAVSGTPDPQGPSNGADGACITNAADARNAGAARLGEPTGDCVSRFGAEDMVGNVCEWVAWWSGQGADGSVASAPVAGYGSDALVNVDPAEIGAADAFPAAACRGGSFGDGAGAGLFAVDLSHTPSSSSSRIGFRCCIE